MVSDGNLKRYYVYRKGMWLGMRPHRGRTGFTSWFLYKHIIPHGIKKAKLTNRIDEVYLKRPILKTEQHSQTKGCS